LAHFSLDGMPPEEVSNRLFQDFKIHTVAVVWEKISGVRVTPHVYTLTSELDKLVKAIEKLAQSKPK
jgi:selenocysteine lyase/cysteine desulfurase